MSTLKASPGHNAVFSLLRLFVSVSSSIIQLFVLFTHMLHTKLRTTAHCWTLRSNTIDTSYSTLREYSSSSYRVFVIFKAVFMFLCCYRPKFNRQFG